MRQKNMIVVTFIVLLITYVSSLEAAESHNVKIFNQNDQPVDNVWVIFDDNLMVTDEKGLIKIEVRSQVENKTVVSLYRTGYHRKELTFKQLLSKEVIVLASKAIDVEGIRVVHERENLGDRTVIQINHDSTVENLADVIKLYGNIEGVSLSGERQTISLGGHHSRHLVVMVDGVVINRMGQPVDIASISLKNIESVEIIHGGSSAISGAGAISGIINLRTRSENTASEYLLNQTIGSFGLKKSSVSLARYLGVFWIDMYAEHSHTKNNFKYVNRQGEAMRRQYNDKQSQNLYLKMVYTRPKQRMSLKFDYRLFNDKLPGPVNYSLLYQDARMNGYTIGSNLTIVNSLDRITINSLIYLSADRAFYDNTRSPHPFFEMKSEHKNIKRGAKLEAHYDAPDDSFLDGSLTVEYGREDFEYIEPTRESNSIEPVYQENAAFRLDTGLNLPILHGVGERSFLSGEWKHSGQARYDITKLWDNYYSWRYVSSYDLFYPQALFGVLISKNYSLPSFYDLYWKGDSQVTGNVDLLPESSVDYRLFGNYQFTRLLIQGSIQRSKVDDLIYWYRSVTGWKPGNIASVQIDEYELSFDYHLNQRLSLSASYAIIDAVNKTKDSQGNKSDFYGNKLPYRPDSRLSSEIRVGLIEALTLNIRHFYTGKQHTTLDQLIDPISSYQTTDIGFKYHRNIRTTKVLFSLSLNNVFDNQYEIYRYTPHPGFNWQFGVSVGNN